MKSKEDYLKRIGEGLDVLSNLRLNIGYAFDKIKSMIEPDGEERDNAETDYRESRRGQNRRRH